MKIVKIRDGKEIDDRIFQAEVVFPSENCYQVTVRDPFLEPGEIESLQEERLRWYFEDHLASPYTDREKAKRATIAFRNTYWYYALFLSPRVTNLKLDTRPVDTNY